MVQKLGQLKQKVREELMLFRFGHVGESKGIVDVEEDNESIIKELGVQKKAILYMLSAILLFFAHIVH